MIVLTRLIVDLPMRSSSAFDEVHATPGYQLTIDLEKQEVTDPINDLTQCVFSQGCA
ncbi:hypothetical protein OURE66S_02317 [Oligella ureolytica]